MTSRRFSVSSKKLRGAPRRLRAISNWAESFKEHFPKSYSGEEKYWNLKIPVDRRLVEGKQTSIDIQRHCAQSLINAAYAIFQGKNKNSIKARVTCVVVLPEMFSSELCIYNSEEYFIEHTEAGSGRFGTLEVIKTRSLAASWGLIIPEGFYEHGVLRTDEDEDGRPWVSEQWYFSETK